MALRQYPAAAALAAVLWMLPTAAGAGRRALSHGTGIGPARLPNCVFPQVRENYFSNLGGYRAFSGGLCRPCATYPYYFQFHLYPYGDPFEAVRIYSPPFYGFGGYSYQPDFWAPPALVLAAPNGAVLGPDRFAPPSPDPAAIERGILHVNEMIRGLVRVERAGGDEYALRWTAPESRLETAEFRTLDASGGVVDTRVLRAGALAGALRLPEDATGVVMVLRYRDGTQDSLSLSPEQLKNLAP